MKIATIALCTAFASIMTLTGCDSDQETMSREYQKSLANIERYLDEIEKNNRQIEFMLCQCRLIDRVDHFADNAKEKIQAIVDDSKRDSIKKVCGLE